MNIRSILFILITGLSTSIYATSLNIDFGSQYTGLPASYGAAAQTGSWNEITQLGSTVNLIDINSASTAVSLNLAADTIGATGSQTTNDTTLLNDQFHSEAGKTWAVTFSGLNQGLYDVYYYAPAHPLVSTGPFFINGGHVNPLSGDTSAVLIQGTSWDVLSNVNVGVTGELTFESDSADTSGFRGLSGLQLVSVTTVPVLPAVWFFATAVIGLFGITKFS